MFEVRDKPKMVERALLIAVRVSGKSEGECRQPVDRTIGFGRNLGHRSEGNDGSEHSETTSTLLHR